MRYFALYLGLVFFLPLLSSNVTENYQHGWTMKGKLTITDRDEFRCRVKVPHRDAVVYLEEITDFLSPRRIKSKISPTGEFSFEVESRYQDYRFYILVNNGGYRAYEKILYAYNAPETYDLTLSCINDMKNFNPDS